jgi:hypothetical protein
MDDKNFWWESMMKMLCPFSDPKVRIAAAN